MSTGQTLFRIKSLIRYLLKAQGIANIHSPFVYEFMLHVLFDKSEYRTYHEIEAIRKRLLQSRQSLLVTDYGAGNIAGLPVRKKISDIVRTAAKPPQDAQLLFRIAHFFQCRNILEIGTSLGISTMYLAASGSATAVTTLEGSASVSGEARKIFEKEGFANITLIAGHFDDTLTTALSSMASPDLVFFDGNHRKEATLNYFQQILPALHESSVLIFDDIYWSVEMKAAWEEIKSDPKVTLTIDLFRLGIAFINRRLSKQDFMLRW